MRKTFKLRQLGILVVDLGLMYLAVPLALLLRSGAWPSLGSLVTHSYHFTYSFALWVLVFYTFGLYRLEQPFDDIRFASRAAAAIVISGLFSALYFYLRPETAIEPKTVLAIVVGLYAATFWLWRYLYGRLRRTRSQRVGVGFIGTGEELMEIISALSAKTPLGYDCRFIYDQTAALSHSGIETIDHPSNISEAVDRTDTDLLIIAEDGELEPSLTRVLFKLLDRRVRYLRLPDFYELILRRVPVGAINETWFLENIDLKAKLSYEWFKRLVDILFAATLLIITLPAWILVASSIKITSPGPVFFNQVRVGRFGRPFKIIKFRTMRNDRNDNAPTEKNDARITSVGAFLRSTRIDEIPQVINILRGEMSFIGPRPERPEIAVTLEQAIPYYSQRHLVKPGITGWDQVSGEYHSPSIEDTYKKLQYDLYYLKNMSFFLDVSVFFKTIMTVLRREGR